MPVESDLPYINLLFFCLPGIELHYCRPIPSSQQHFPAPPWGSWGILRPAGMYDPLGEFWAYRKISSDQTGQEELQDGVL